MEWVSVSNKLPDLDKRVLAFDGYEIYVAWIDDTSIGNWKYSECCGCYTFNDVTHWAQLPKPPEL